VARRFHVRGVRSPAPCAVQTCRRAVEDPNTSRGFRFLRQLAFIASLVLFVSFWEGDLETRFPSHSGDDLSSSFFMVSTVPYYSFKKLDLKNHKPFNVLVSIILVAG